MQTLKQGEMDNRMAQCLYAVVLLASWIIHVKGGTADGCPPADPNCHPSCIVYDANHCRYCRCVSGYGNDNSASSWSTGSDGSTDASWDTSMSGGDWSDKVGHSDAWSDSGGSFGGSSVSGFRNGGSGNGYGGSVGFSNGGSGGYSGGSSSGQKEETVKYIIVEKESPKPSYTQSIYPVSHGMLSSPMSSSPFSGASSLPSSLTPGSNEIVDTASYPGAIVHVPLIAPGQPRYCVRCRILSCPRSCERVDSYGCHSCPCAPSRFQTMPIMRDCSNPVVESRQPDCSATRLCVESCKDGYYLGDVDSSGCLSCTCIKAAPSTTPKPVGCPATLACMLRCKDGYYLGETQRDGCPACRCLNKGAMDNHNSNNNNRHNDNNNNNWSNGGGSAWNSNNNNNNYNNNNSGRKRCGNKNNNYLTSSNGISSGGEKCEPPMCLDGHMTVDTAMRIGEESAGGGFGGSNNVAAADDDDCEDGVLDTGSYAGYGGMTDNNNMGGGSGGSSSHMAGMTGTSNMGNNNMGTSNMGTNNMGTSNMGTNNMGTSNMGTNNMGTSNTGTSNMGNSNMMGNSNKDSGSCFPMCQSGTNNQMTSGSGSTGGMTMGGGNGGGGGRGSGCSGPFCAIMSGGSSLSGGGGGGSGMPFSPFSSAMSGGGGPGMNMPGAGMSRTAGSAMGTASDEHKECPDLIHCLVTCDGRYMLGGLDSNGCQQCTCT